MKLSKTPSRLLLSLCGCLLLAAAACRDREPARREAVEDGGRARPATHAGTWYPSDAPVLRHAIKTYLEAHEATSDSTPILALIGPHAGLRFSGSVAAAGYAALARQPVSRVFLLGPSHYADFSGIALPAPDLRSYATPMGELFIDKEAVAALRGRPGYDGPPAAHDQEHSLEMHAIFLAAVHPEAALIPLVVGHLGDRSEVRALASQLRPLLRPGDVVIASSDFTHYGPNYRYRPFEDDVPRRLDELLQAATEPLLRRDLAGFEAHLSRTGDTVCGQQPLRLLLAMLPADVTGQKLAADTSGRITGDFRNSVTYMTVAYRREGAWPIAGPEVLGPAGRQLALRIARSTLVSFLESGHVPDDRELGIPPSGVMREIQAAFVTLKKEGRLRGCIGHIFPVEPLWKSIRDNAVAAAVKDRRFRPVTASELGDLEIEISVLTPLAAIEGPDQVEIGRHGVLLQVFGRSAVFLPQVATENSWDRITTLSQLALKAGLAANAWRTPAARLSVFEAQVFAEAPATVGPAQEPPLPKRG